MADAHGSGPCDSNIMRVQVPFPAGKKKEVPRNTALPFLNHIYVFELHLT